MPVNQKNMTIPLSDSRMTVQALSDIANVLRSINQILSQISQTLVRIENRRK